MSDSDLVDGVRARDDDAFAELYRRYEQRVESFVRSMVRDPGRAEDVTQDVFLAALRRLRVTEGELAFKPWIYEIARNASIDLYRRRSHTEEVPIEGEGLPAADRMRLVSNVGPDAALNGKQRLEHLRGALDELPDNHNRILVLRELEGLSYREIADRMEMSRGAVESALFRARRRLELEFSEIDTGRRCTAARRLAVRQAEAACSVRERLRLDRHLRRCASCARHARSLGVERLGDRVGARIAALLPLPPLLWRRGLEGIQGSAAWAPVASQGSDGATGLLGKAALLLAAAAMAGSGAALGGGGPIAGELGLDRDRAVEAVVPAAPARSPAQQHRRSVGAVRPAPDGPSAERRPASRIPREGVARVRPGTRAADALAPRLTLPAAPPAPSVGKGRVPAIPTPAVRVQAIRVPVAASAQALKPALARVHTPTIPTLPARPAAKLPTTPAVGATTGGARATVDTVSSTSGVHAILGRVSSTGAALTH